MKYKLHLQWKKLKFDHLIEIEDCLNQALSSKAEISGHEIGRDEADIFISTDDAQGTFEETKTILMSLGYWDGIRVAFRETSGTNTPSSGRKLLQRSLRNTSPLIFP